VPVAAFKQSYVLTRFDVALVQDSIRNEQLL
jgi:hypothetical protein